jgi:hypothetical protein
MVIAAIVGSRTGEIIDPSPEQQRQDSSPEHQKPMVRPSLQLLWDDETTAIAHWKMPPRCGVQLRVDDHSHLVSVGEITA